MTPTQKPRIKRAICHPYGGYMWICVGDGVIGKHHTPQNAYIEWKTSVVSRQLTGKYKSLPISNLAKRT